MKFKKLFFSYSRMDADFALKLALDLKKEGFDVWIDQEDIRAGSEWDLEIEKALATCDCLLFIQSEKSVNSTNVLDEVYYALEENKTVIPVVIGNSKTPFRIKRLHYINFIGDYANGLANLKEDLGNTVLPEIVPASSKKRKSTISIPVKYLFTALLVIIALMAFFYFKKSTPEIKQEPVIETINLQESFTGEWTLSDMEPKFAEKKGYLKIEDAGEGKVKIMTSFQFYYPKANDTAYLEVFNAFAECASCVLKTEIPLKDRRIDIGAHKYVTLKENQPGGGKAGDTVLNAGINTAVSASLILYLINKDSAVIKVQQPDSTFASRGIIIPPFAYSFFFRKVL